MQCAHLRSSLFAWLNGKKKVVELLSPMLNRLRPYINRQILISIRNLLNSTHNILAEIMNQSINAEAQAPGPPPFDPKEAATPVSFPIKTLEELESRSYLDSFHFPFNVAAVKLGGGDVALANRPRILVCHDMAGGYSDDKWVQGGSNEGAYAIWHWYLIDVFVYFSHALVTLPPPCWTNTAHRHGVKVLGTFIVEWDEGKVIANKLLSTKESAQMYADRLTELAAALGFDGWLINMEVQLDISRIPILKEFVSHLTKTMHSAVPGGLVIWYDSVTIAGDLSWQNLLNDSNKPFFDICDGIFVNYSWLEDYPKLSATAAGNRKFDVYMGIDVFGRGTYGDGQWTTNVALDVLKKDDVSAAIFAPGWVYETKQPPDFQTAQNRWWSLVNKSWGMVKNYPKALPFYSNFDQGHGYHFSVDGRQVSDAPWNNLSNQSFQPFLKFSEDPSSDTVKVTVDFKEASYNGGGNITFKGTLEGKAYFTTRLFQGELLMGNLPVHFTYSVKSDGSSLVGLSLDFSSSIKKKASILLASQGNTLLTMNRFTSTFSNVIMPNQVKHPEAAPGWIIQESSIAMEGYTLTGIHAVCYKLNPGVVGQLKPESESPAAEAADSSVVRGSTEYYAVLGHITAKTSAQNLVFPPSTEWVVSGEDIKWSSGSQGSKTLNCKIHWKLKAGNASMFTNYNIYAKKQDKQAEMVVARKDGGVADFLGVAQVESFYVADLLVSPGTSSLTFIIQVCGVDGTCQKLDDSPSLQLHVEG